MDDPAANLSGGTAERDDPAADLSLKTAEADDQRDVI